MRIVAQPGENQLTCHSCGCVLAYTEEDIREWGDPSWYAAMGVKTQPRHYINCLNCNKLIHVKTHKEMAKEQFHDD